MKTLARTSMLIAALAGTNLYVSNVYADTPASDKDNQHKKITQDQLPAKAKATADKEAKGKTVGSVYQSTKSNGDVVYEVDIIDNGAGTILSISPTGDVVDRRPDSASPKHDDLPKSDTSK